MTHRITLRRINGTLRVSVPPEYKKQHNLKVGDVAIWTEDANGVHLRFVKIDEVLEQQEAPQETQGAAA